MQIFDVPTQVPPPTPDYTNYDWDKERQAEEDHIRRLKEWLRANGYTGKYTGEIYSEGVADGYARYMVAQGPRKFVLIHLPYGDAYQARDVQFLPRYEIIRRIEAEKKFQELWKKQGEKSLDFS